MPDTPRRRQNERLILSLIRAAAQGGGALARSDLARVTGLSAQTVTNIARDLIAEGLLDPGPPQRGKVGQPLRPLALRGDGAWFLGLKIGRRRAEMVLMDFTGQVIATHQQGYDHPQPAPITTFAARGAADLRRAIPAGAQHRLAGLGVAMPFFLWDWGAAMEGWRGFDVEAELAAATGLPVWVENDASCACGAELLFGAPDLPADFLYIYLAHFAGGGLVLDGRLRLGPHRNAGAIGSVVVTGLGGRPAQLLDRASVSTLEARVGRVLPAQGDDWDLPVGLRLEWLAEAAAGIAQAAVAAVALADLGAVLIDGAMPAAMRADLVTATRRAMDAQIWAGLVRPDLREGSLGPGARALGAAALPLTAHFGLPDAPRGPLPAA